MSEYKRHAPHLLSGGQKQRIAIAGILAMKPKCIIFDEPTAMLDPSGRKEVLDTIIDLNKNYGITVILITHYMDEAAKADRIVVMDKGKPISLVCQVFLQLLHSFLRFTNLPKTCFSKSLKCSSIFVPTFL